MSALKATDLPGSHRHRVALTAMASVVVAGLLMGVDYNGSTDSATVSVTATQAAAQGAPTQGITHAGRIEEWVRAPACSHGGHRNDQTPSCFDPQWEVHVTCSNGTAALSPWWMRYRRSNGQWSSWSMVSWYQCPQDQLRAAIENAWDRMPIAANTITVQPNTGWVLTTVPTIVFVDRSPRTMTTTLLGTSVRIRATPSAYTWAWGDGASTVTTQPGAAYPNQTVAHTYLNREGSVTISLTTSWRGSYSTNGGATWTTAPGTAHTTSTPITVEVYNPHGHRVDCDLNGDCLSGADGPADDA